MCVGQIDPSLIRSMLVFFNIDFSKSTSSKLTNQAEYFEEKYGNSNKKILNIDSQIDNLNRKYFEEKERKTDLLIKLNDQQNSMSQYYSKLINIFGLSEEDVEYRWAGIMGTGRQKTPIVTSLNKNIHYGIRLGGMGVALGTELGADLAQCVNL